MSGKIGRHIRNNSTQIHCTTGILKMPHWVKDIQPDSLSLSLSLGCWQILLHVPSSNLWKTYSATDINAWKSPSLHRVTFLPVFCDLIITWKHLYIFHAAQTGLCSVMLPKTCDIKWITTQTRIKTEGWSFESEDETRPTPIMKPAFPTDVALCCTCCNRTAISEHLQTSFLSMKMKELTVVDTHVLHALWKQLTLLQRH